MGSDLVRENAFVDRALFVGAVVEASPVNTMYGAVSRCTRVRLRCRTQVMRRARKAYVGEGEAAAVNVRLHSKAH